ncbi:5'-methylthioadenosine/S-adenosylhomocysteine nucleosidase family protein [Streptomyces sp. NPDC054784]
MTNNRGIINRGDHNTLSNNAIGDGARVSPDSSPRDSGLTPREEKSEWDIGVVTILSEELRAVVGELKLERRKESNGLYFYRGKHVTPDATVNVVATQSQSQGQRSAMSALENLRRHYSPRLWVMVGVGGGIHKEYARVGNVIVSTEVVYYENRKLNPGGDVRRRGEHRQAPAPVVHAVNAYFTDNGTPARIHGQTSDHVSEEFAVYPGVIGSGEAVIADAENEVRRYLERYNEKVLAVDMEAGGLSQYWQENSVDGGDNPGWLVVRGVSDNADEEKGHGFHELAARNAAYVLRQLVPYLC